MEVYVMVAGIYYDPIVDFSTQMWKELLKSVGNTIFVQGVSCARYWSLILQYKYEKEGIEVPADEQKVELLKYNFQKAIEDDEEMFPNIARIPDAILKRVDPTNSVLMEYLILINPNVKTSVLLAKLDEGSSKKYRRSKKNDKSTTEQPVNEPVVKKSPKNDLRWWCNFRKLLQCLLKLKLSNHLPKLFL